MDLIIGIERLTALVFIVTGLSHIAAPRAWAHYFIDLRDKGAVPGFINAWIHGPLGFLIVAFHWLWSWPGIVVTVVGCGLTLKASLHFIFPSLAMRSLAHVSEEQAGGFRAFGFVAVAFGLFVGWISLGAPHP